MAQAQSVNVTQLVDEQKVSGFHVGLVIWAFLVMIADGYDLLAVSFAAPSLAKVWHITNRAAFGPVFSASFVGMLFGAPLFGYIGDRFGRKRAIVWGALWFGVFTLAAAWADSLQTLIVLRFLAGIGLGGALPNAIALTAEYAPHRYRATMVILMFTGVTFGGVIPGPLAAKLVPTYGWQILFIVGGAIPIVVAAIVAFMLPESLKYLAIHPRHSERAIAIANRLAPGRNFGPGTRFVVAADETRGANTASPAVLFQYGLGWVTPILWLLFVINLMVFYFINLYIPLVLTKAGYPIGDAALAASAFQLGGTIGGLVLARPLDRYGFVSVTILFALAVPIVGAIGYLAGVAEAALMTITFLAGFCLLGLQFGLNASAGLIYPTAFRSYGVGWALGIGRFGSIMGPLFGGLLVATALPIQQLYLIAAIPLVIGTIASVILVRVYARVEHTEGLEPEPA
jgi:AAHS family 4-hydroxybenzoate transporter-like MFS transporter